jgi:hypothetical protein
MMAKAKNIVETNTEDLDMKPPVHKVQTHEENMAMIERLKKFESLSLDDLYKKSLEAQTLTIAIEEAIKAKRVKEVKKLATNIAEQVSAADFTMKEIIDELLVYVPPELKIRLVRKVKSETKSESKARPERKAILDNADVKPVSGSTYKLPSGEVWKYLGKGGAPKVFLAAIRDGVLWNDLLIATE